MPATDPQHWGKQAIREAELRETNKTVKTQVNSGHRYHLELKLNTETGHAYVQGHPFVSSAAAIAAVAEKFAQLEAARTKHNASA